MVYARIFIGLFCLLALLPGSAYARYDYKFDSQEVPMGQFESEMSSKLERGVNNTLFGASEVLRVPVDWSSDPAHGKIQAFTIGIPYGAARAAGRVITGVYEIATFYIPQKPIFYPIEGEVL